MNSKMRPNLHDDKEEEEYNCNLKNYEFENKILIMRMIIN